jgi:Domain of unknown function (DUF4185)
LIHSSFSVPIAIFAALMTALAPARAAEALARVGAVEKICQLTGETDWQSGQPTAAKTLSRFGLDAADLGYPIEHHGKLVLLFGDSWPTLQPVGTLVEAPPNDAVGIVTAQAPPSTTACLGMRILDKPGLTMRIKDSGAPMPVFAPATVTGPMRIDQGFFDVPSGGVSMAGALYGFFWTGHCAKGHPLAPSPQAPLARPGGDARCPEDDHRNSIGLGVMARSGDDGRSFQDAMVLPPGFVYSIAVNPATEGAAAQTDDDEIFIFGVPRYRASIPYLAKVPAKSFSRPQSWRFLVGRTADDQPQWTDYRRWSAGATAKAGTHWRPPSGSAQIIPEDPSAACVGEFSITWNRVLKRWLMFYNCTHGIEARIAANPWGPWSPPTTILSATDDMHCRWLMGPAGCGARRDFWPGRRQGNTIVSGGFYAPFVLNRYTQAGQGGADLRAVVYWLVSTWNPYEVSVLRTTLEIPR